MSINQNTHTVKRNCPHCSNTVLHSTLVSDNLPAMDENHNIYLDAWGREKPKKGTYLLYKCSTCHKPTLVFFELDNDYEPKEGVDFTEIMNAGLGYKETLLYPNAKALTKDVPDSISKIYKEAIGIKNKAPNAFAVQTRKALEALCEEQGAPASKQIFDKLKYLSEQGKFPDGLLEMGHIIRKVSRLGAHPKDEDISVAEADMLDDIFNLIIDYVYLTPAKVRALENKIEKVAK